MDQASGKPLIVGARSMLGMSVASALKRASKPYVAVDRSPSPHAEADSLVLDLAASPEHWPDVSRWDASTALLFAAVTSEKACQNDPQLARTVNVDHTIELARRFVARGVRVIFPSTNLVFDGSCKDVPAGFPHAPRTLYGRLKSEAESLLLALNGEVAVVRLPKVLSPDNPLLVGWRKALAAGETVTAFSDLMVAPISSELAAEVFVRLAARPCRGLFQISALDEVSYADLAVMLARLIGAPEELVTATTSSAAGVHLDHLPKHVSMDSERIVGELGIRQPSSRETIEQVMNGRSQ